jgi:pimeloyl-ACP methyl ester carboxylesterase
MFGFGRLAQVDYFAHLEDALKARFKAQGLEVETFVSDVPPTASIRRRAGRLAELISRTAEHEGPIHLIGHSTGGLDARVVASPSGTLAVPPEKVAFRPRLRTITTLNTPHFGTPLASFFTTVSGQRLLYALSALTFIALSLGGPPLSAAGALVLAIGRIDKLFGVRLRVLDSATDSLLNVLEPEKMKEVTRYLEAIKSDQGAMVQLMPEAMDLFVAGIEDSPTVHYQSVATMANPPSPGKMVRALRHPWAVLSGTIFATLYGITSRMDERYPCSAEKLDPAAEAVLRAAFGEAPGGRANDGVVPIRSQIWGKLIWAGRGDHLDVLGHFWGDKGSRHVDWLTSGSGFDEARFHAMVDCIANGMFSAEPR